MAATDGSTGDNRRQGPTVFVLSPSRSIGMSHYARGLASGLAPHADVRLLDRVSWKEGLPHMVMTLRRLLRASETPYVIGTSPHWSLPVILRWVGAHGAHVMHGPLIYMANRFTRPIYIAYYRAVTSRLRVVILHADRFVEAVRALGLGQSRIVVVPHGFVPDELVQRSEYDPEGPFICIGRLLPYKGVDVFVEALRILQDRGQSVRAVIGGEGVTLGLAPGSIEGLEILPGHVSDASFAALIDRCSAVVLPYRNATQSGVLAHAFIAGRPVIATEVGSFPEYVDAHNGYLVPPNDPGALADAIATFRRDPALSRRLAVGARRAWEERLDPDASARKILEALGI